MDQSEVLAQFGVGPITSDRLVRFQKKYPEHAECLVSFAAELVLDTPEGAEPPPASELLALEDELRSSRATREVLRSLERRERAVAG